jgi:prepilin-type N-terminal cleavage/methylation domain-containing protein
MRRAFTLIEIMLVLAVSGVLLGIALPSLAQLLDTIEVESAAAHIVAAHQRARILAITKGQVLQLSIQPDRLLILPRGGTTPLWSEDGPLSSGVTLEGSPRQFSFSPQGFTLGLSNASVPLIRGRSRRTVVISRLGRVRVVP